MDRFKIYVGNKLVATAVTPEGWSFAKDNAAKIHEFVCSYVHIVVQEEDPKVIEITLT